MRHKYNDTEYDDTSDLVRAGMISLDLVVKPCYNKQCNDTEFEQRQRIRYYRHKVEVLRKIIDELYMDKNELRELLRIERNKD